MLRLFGARVGNGVVIHPGVNIKFPWKLRIGDHSWIGQRVWLDNLDMLTIGNNVVISQGAMIIQGSHDYKKVDYPTYSKPVVLEDGSWVGAGAIVTLGVPLKSYGRAGRRQRSHQGPGGVHDLSGESGGGSAGAADRLVLVHARPIEHT